jgi:hypothetical protein
VIFDPSPEEGMRFGTALDHHGQALGVIVLMYLMGVLVLVALTCMETELSVFG